MTDKRKFAPEDLYKFKFVSDPQLSPDANEVLYVRTHIKEDHEKYESHIWLYDVEARTDRQFTHGCCSDMRPRWSPDGKHIAFISERDDKKQLYLLPRAGGEAELLVKFQNGINNPKWSPDGNYIAFTARCEADDTVEELQSEKDNKEDKKSKVVKVTNNLKYKADGAGLLDDKRTHIFVVDVNTHQVTRVTKDHFEHSEPTWSVDSKAVVFGANRNEDYEYTIRFSDLWQVSIEGGEPKRLTDGEGRYYSPSFSADGQLLAYYGHKSEFDSATSSKLYVADLKAGETRCLTCDYDRSMGSQDMTDMKIAAPMPGPVWSKDSSSIYVTTSTRGETHIYRVAMSDGQLEQVSQGVQQILGYSICPQQDIAAIVYSNAHQPGDLALLNLVTKEQTRCTKVNEEILNECYIATPEEVSFTGVEGWDIQGWMLKPIGFKEDKKYPFILEVHGGPHAMYSPNFFFEFQILTSNGYVVMFTNPRGSHGYGQKFVNAVRGDYGGNDYGDLMKAVDYAATLDYVDEERMGVTGGSYGGFMTNWIVGQTDRFKAAVTQRSISNWISFYGVSDIGYFFTEGEIQAQPWSDVEKLLKHSPMSYVQNVTTPLLIIHGEQDLRCPIEQAEQYYVFLKRMKKNVEFARYPGATHDLSRSGQPNQRVDRLTRIVGWFNDYIERTPEDYSIKL